MKEPSYEVVICLSIATGLVVSSGENNVTNDVWAQKIIGDATAMAHHLQKIINPNQIIICSQTRQLIGSFFDCRPIESKMVFNQKEVSGWIVTSKSDISNRFDAIRSVNSKFVGREEELDQISRRAVLAKRGQGQLILIEGEAGIGKSRLAREALKQIRSDNTEFVNYDCSSLHCESTYHPIICQLLQSSEILAEDETKTKQIKLKKFLKLPSMIKKEDWPIFQSLVLTSENIQDGSFSYSPTEKKEKTLSALLSHLDRTLAKKPLFMVVEDLHWIDPSSLEFLTRLIEQAANKPLLIIATARPEFSPTWPELSHILKISLGRLDSVSSSTIIETITADRIIDSKTYKNILVRSEGIPLFIEELTKTVIERDKTSHSNKQALNSSVPLTLHASLLSRLDQLSLGKKVARSGAAVGVEFSYKLVRKLVDYSEGELQSALCELVNSGLLLQRGKSKEASFKFKHILVRDAAYSTLLKRDLKKIHFKIFQ